MTISRFRWVFCQLQELKKLRSTREQSIEAALRSLPVGLNATYERMLDRIDQCDRKEASTMLNWLSFALQTLTLGELQEARLINPENGGSVAWDDPGSMEDIIEILGDLIHVEEPLDVITPGGSRWKSKDGRDWVAFDSYRNYARLHGGDPSSDIFCPDDLPSSDRTELYNAWRQQEGRQFARIRLAHFSVKEYLVSAHVESTLFHDLPFHGPRSQRFLAESCLAYLRNYSNRTLLLIRSSTTPSTTGFLTPMFTTTQLCPTKSYYSATVKLARTGCALDMALTIPLTAHFTVRACSGTGLVLRN
jgi:hypothetical protein